MEPLTPVNKGFKSLFRKYDAACRAHRRLLPQVHSVKLGPKHFIPVVSFRMTVKRARRVSAWYRKIMRHAKRINVYGRNSSQPGVGYTFERIEQHLLKPKP